MKLSIQITLLIIALMETSCGNKPVEGLVTFETPQPVNKSDIKHISKRFEGKYSPLNPSSHYYNASPSVVHTISVVDTVSNANSSRSTTYESNVLQIWRDLIVETRISHAATLLDSADRVNLRDTTFAIDEYGVSSHIVIKGDSSFYHTISKDTLYSSLRGDLFRNFKGYYFLNQKTPDGKWFVRKLNKFKNGVILGTILTAADIDKLKLISESESDTTNNFKLSRKQFKEFIKNNGFNDEDVYVKID